MYDSITTIGIDEIDFDDLRYEIDSPVPADTRSDAHLEASIHELGLIQPLILKKKNDQRLSIVSGFRRGRVLKKMRVKTAPALVISSRGRDSDLDLLCIKVAVLQKSFENGLTDSALIKAIALLNEHLDHREISGVSGVLFNRPLNPAIIQDFLKVSGLPPAAAGLLSEGHLSLKPAVRIADLDPRSIDSFLLLFRQINASVSSQLNIVDLCIEIIRREKIDLSELIDEPGVQSIISHEQMDSRTKAARISEYLWKRRYPAVSEREKEFNDTCRQLNLTDRFTVKPPKNFEGLEYQLTMRFQSIPEFREQIRKLDAIGQTPQFQSLIP